MDPNSLVWLNTFVFLTGTVFVRLKCNYLSTIERLLYSIDTSLILFRIKSERTQCIFWERLRYSLLSFYRPFHHIVIATLSVLWCHSRELMVSLLCWGTLPVFDHFALLMCVEIHLCKDRGTMVGLLLRLSCLLGVPLLCLFDS